MDATRVIAMRRLAIDAATVEMVAALRSEGIRSVLLKGAAIAARLYDEPGKRSYSDFDLLVGPARYGDAVAVVQRLGYRQQTEKAPATRRGLHADTWVRGEAALDLHHRLFWFRGEPGDLWDALTADTRRLRLAGTEVEVLSDPALALVITSHRVQHGSVGQPIHDLERALSRFDLTVWRDTRELARRLGMLQVLGVGLAQTPVGRTLASELGLPIDADLEMGVRLAGNIELSGLLRLRTAGSKLGAARLVLREFIPPAAVVRHRWRFARRGRVALMLTYLYRGLKFAYHLPTTLFRIRAARRAAARDS